MSDLASLHAIVCGHVQGVFFRAFVTDKAAMLGLTGCVKNLPTDDTVEVWAEGEREKLEQLLNYLIIGPPHANVDRVNTEWSDYTGKYNDFQIEYT